MLNASPPPPLRPDEGPNFATHRLVREGSVWVFRPKGVARMFPLAFSAMGCVFLAAGIVAAWQSLVTALAAFGGGALAIGVGRYLANTVGTGARFDTLRRIAEIPEQRAPGLHLGASPGFSTLGFAEVRALEILHKRVTDTEIDDYDNCELNLVTRKGPRINLASHPDCSQIAREAKTLGTVLGVAVIDWRSGTAAGHGGDPKPE